MRMQPTVYAERRARLAAALGDDGVAIFMSHPERTRSHDTTYAYRPSSDIVYLSGFEEPECVLVFAPGHDEGDFAMFVRPRDPDKETWDGLRAGPEGARQKYGADVAYGIDELDAKLPSFLQGREVLHYTLGYDAAFDGRVAGWMNKLRYRRGAPPAAPRLLADARDIVHEMRLRKTPDELTLMREAARISAEAHVHAMRATAPGEPEFKIQAALEFHFRTNGADYPAYTSIVGGGANATVLHYVTNRDILADGEVLLVDAGCEFDFYAADITRSYPVSGRFTPEQRDAYQAVLEAQKACIGDVVVGTPYGELQERAAQRLTGALIDLGLLTGSVDENIEQGTYKKFYPHRVGHWLGMDVHDVGSYYQADGNWRPLEEGMVVTVEPGLYFPVDDEVPQALRGVGIRIEDDVAATAQGPENLTASCPKEIAELEDIIGTAC